MFSPDKTTRSTVNTDQSDQIWHLIRQGCQASKSGQLNAARLTTRTQDLKLTQGLKGCMLVAIVAPYIIQDSIILPKVPITTVTTTWSDPNMGEGYILTFNKVLFFGNNLDHKLVNSNQLRHNDIPVYDNPYELDPSRAMGIVITNTCQIPLQSLGMTI